METIFLRILNMSVTASYVILAVLALRLLLKKAPKRFSYLLWSAVGFRLCCPVSFAAALSLFNIKLFDMTKAQTVGSAALEYVPQNIGMMARPAVTTGIPAANAIVNPALPAAVSEYSINPMQIWLAVFTVVWCVGAAALLVYGTVSYIRLRRRMVNAVRLEGNVYESDRVSSPFVLGFARPRIYLPFGLDANAREYVLLHERHHLRRLDHIVKPFAFVLLALNWFNPLCWLAFALMSRDMEMSCDERVLGGEQANNKSYSLTLLSFAAGKRFPAPSPLAFSETDVKSRIKNALRFRKPAAWVSVVAAVLCLVAVTAFAANPKSERETLAWAKNLAARNIVSVEMEVLPNSGDDAYRRFAEDEFEDVATLINDYRGDYVAKPEELAGGAIILYVTTTDGARHTVTNMGNAYLVVDGDAYDAGYDWLSAWPYTKGDSRVPDDFYGNTSVAYVSSRCVYMNPLSSFYPFDGDSGYLYQIGDNSFTVILKATGEVQFAASSIAANWGPFSDDEWTQLFEPVVGAPDISAYAADSRRMLRLGDEYCLLRLDGTFWVAELRESLRGGAFVWSVYELTPEAASGVSCTILTAGAEYRCAMNWYADNDFDFDYDELPVTIINGDGTLAFAVPEDVDTLTVGEDYYAHTDETAGIVERETYTLARDTEGRFTLNIIWRNSIRDEEAVYFVPYGDGKYVFKVRFSGESSSETTVGGADTLAQVDTSSIASIGGADAASEVTIVQNWQDIDVAVSEAILAHNKGIYAPGDFACESHAVLATESGSPAGTNKIETVTVYVLALYQEFDFADGAMEQISGSYNVPTALTFSVEGEGKYALTEYWTPREKEYFESDIREKFPEGVADSAMNAQGSTLAQKQSCYAQAVEYAKMDTDIIIASLIDSIMSSPEQSSHPGEYVKAHPVEYQTLTYYGDYTLRYIFKEFLQGEQTGLKGHIMRIVMDDLIGDEALKRNAENGQAYFNAWLENARKTEQEYGMEKMAEIAPKAYLLLEMTAVSGGV